MRNIHEYYRHRIDGRALLDHYGALNRTEQIGSDGTVEIVHSCLLENRIPHHTNGDANPSASLNPSKSLYYCPTLSWGGNLVQLVQTLEDKPIQDAIPTISSFLLFATADTETFSQEVERLLQDPLPTPPIPSYSENVLTPWLYHHPYVAERGIPEEIQALLKIGFDCEENRIVIPHFWDGKLVGWQKRSIPLSPGRWPATPNPHPKYRSSPAMPKSETLYNYDPSVSHVVLVESPMSVAKAFALGLTNVVASFGAAVSDRQVELLRPFQRVTVWLDEGPAGERGSRKVVEALWRHTDVRMVIPDERDLGDYTVKGEAVNTIVSATPASYMLARWDEESRYGEAATPQAKDS